MYRLRCISCFSVCSYIATTLRSLVITMTSALFIIAITLDVSIAKNDSGKLEEMIQSILRDKISDSDVTLDLSIESTAKFNELKTRENEIDAVSLLHFSPTHAKFSTEIKLTDNTRYEISGRYIAYKEIPVVIKKIYQGDVISQQDLTVARIKLNSIKNEYISSIDSLIGMQAKNNISTGSPIRKRDISMPKIIHEGDVVSLLYKTSAMQIKTVGTAMNSCAIGEIAKVKNNSTGIIVHGRVLSKDVIEVSVE